MNFTEKKQKILSIWRNRKMEEFKNIIKVINDKLAENERTIDYYREESRKSAEVIAKLEEEKKALQERIDRLTF